MVTDSKESKVLMSGLLHDRFDSCRTHSNTSLEVPFIVLNSSGYSHAHKENSSITADISGAASTYISPHIPIQQKVL